MDSLNSRMPRPSDLPTSGRRFGPRTMSAMTSTMMSSIGPMLLNGMGHDPFSRWSGKGTPRRMSVLEGIAPGAHLEHRCRGRVAGVDLPHRPGDVWGGDA